MIRTKTISEVVSELSKNEYLVIDKYDSLAIVFDRGTLQMRGQEKIKQMYEVIDFQKGLLSEIDINSAIREIIEKISDKIELKRMLKEAIKTNDPRDIVGALKRLRDETLAKKVKPTKGCYSMKIPGKKGQRPIELVLTS